MRESKRRSLKAASVRMEEVEARKRMATMRDGIGCEQAARRRRGWRRRSGREGDGGGEEHKSAGRRRRRQEVQMGLRRRQSQDSMGVNQAVPRERGNGRSRTRSSLPSTSPYLQGLEEAQHFHTINQLRRRSEIWGSTTTIPERSLHKSQ